MTMNESPDGMDGCRGIFTVIGMALIVMFVIWCIWLAQAVTR